MKRRNFIKTTAIGSALLVTDGVFSFMQATEMKKEYGNLIDPIIPFEFYPNLEKEMLSYIIDLKNRYGFRRFLITGPTKEYRYTGFPEKQVFRDLGEQIINIKKQLAGYDIEIGWWCVTTIRIGNGRFQGIIKEDGSIVKESPCPLDQEYRDKFSDYVATVVQIARPFWINFEDDFHLSGGCYCPLHLEEFGKRQNRYYSREELQTILHANTPESYRLQQAWGELSRDSLAKLATSVREKVDQIAPKTRLSYVKTPDGMNTMEIVQSLLQKLLQAIPDPLSGFRGLVISQIIPWISLKVFLIVSTKNKISLRTSNLFMNQIHFRIHDFLCLLRN